MNGLDHPAQPGDEDGPPVDGQTRDLAAAAGPVVRDPAAEIQRLREQLLGGRGPGATERERTVFMHNWPTLGALPTMIERELVQVHTDLARRDPAAIEGDLERVRLQLAGTLDQLVVRLSPARRTASARRHLQTRVEALLDLPPRQPVGESEWETRVVHIECGRGRRRGRGRGGSVVDRSPAPPKVVAGRHPQCRAERRLITPTVLDHRKK